MTIYPQLWDNEGRTRVELGKVRSSLTFFLSRMTRIRDHGEGRREINLITEVLRHFLKFHRREIGIYLAQVQEGHRSQVKDELRNSSNECIMPLLEFMDKIKDLNSQMGSCRGPLSEYRTLLVELGDLRGSVELVRFIEPSPLLG